MLQFYETQGNSNYDGMYDTDYDAWLNASFLEGRYEEYNQRFFGNKLPNNIPIYVSIFPTNVTALGSTSVDFIDTTRNNRVLLDSEIENSNSMCIKVIVNKIVIRNTRWASRYQFENALVHEMCHVCQVYEILNQDSQQYIMEYSHNKGHGKSFAEASMKVNLNTDNHDNEQFFVSSNAFRNDALRRGEQFHHTLYRVRYCLERHLRISTQVRDTLASYGCYIENHQVKYSHKLIHECRT